MDKIELAGKLAESTGGCPQVIKTVLGELIQKDVFQGSGTISGLATGLCDLDDLIRGLHAGDVIVLASRPGIGKSALALNIAEHAAADLRVRVAFFSLETSSSEVALRLLSSRARVDGQRLRKGTLSDAEAARVRDVGGFLYQTPLYIDDTPGLELMAFAERAESLHSKHPLALAIIDSIHLMEPLADDAPYTRVTRLIHALKAVARGFNVPILVTAQLAALREGLPTPKLTDLRESGAIAEDADVLLLLDREATRLKPGTPEYDTVAGQAELFIAKQRNGPTGLVKLTWLREYTRFESWSYPGHNAGHDDASASREPSAPF